METTSGMSSALIITGGFCDIELARAELPAKADLIIAADSGYRTAVALGVKPDIAMGDFDSLVGALPEGLPIYRVPSEKDVTDTMLACDYAREKGCAEITIVGGTGGRIDHSLSNILYLEALHQLGVRATLTDGANTVRFIENETVTIPAFDGYFSIFAVDECRVTESGCKYPLDEATLVRSLPYALSNEVTSDMAVVSVKGRAIFVLSRK